MTTRAAEFREARGSTVRKKGRTRTLLVVGCGKSKVWQRQPGVGRVPARDAYTSSLFKLCKRYAEERQPNAWVILSAKYGFLLPDRKISDYDASFASGTSFLSKRRLAAQWRRLFWGVRRVESLAGAAYNEVLAEALPPAVKLELPLKGLGLFQRTAWLTRQLCLEREGFPNDFLRSVGFVARKTRTDGGRRSIPAASR